jgi:methyl-accepting chemotaxis protein
MTSALSISQKMLVLILAFLLALGSLAGVLIYGQVETLNQAQASRRLIALAGDVGQLIHTLQVERGLTAGFLSGQGELPPALREARAASDKVLQAFGARSEEHTGTAFGNELTATLGKMGALIKERDNIDQRRMAAAQAIAAYSTGIEQLTAVVGHLLQVNQDSNGLLDNVALMNIFCEKEFAGRERAFVNATLTAGAFSAQSLAQQQRLVGRQDACAMQLQLLGTEAVRAQAKETAANPATQALLGVRQSMIDEPLGQPSSIAPAQWFKTASERITVLKNEHDQLLSAMKSDAEGRVAGARNYLLIISAVLLLGGLLLAVFAWRIAASTAKALQETVALANSLREGDLTVRIVGDSHTETGQLKLAMGALQGKLREMFGDINGKADTIAQGAGQVATAAREIGQAASNQSQATSSSAAAIEEMTTSIGEVSDIARQTESNASQTSGLSAEGAGLVKEVALELAEITATVSTSSVQIKELMQRSLEIGQIANVIKEIADQTNLLALNAAIEAARAGEQGRGFAVVADEVRKLAERTTQATSEIAQTIAAIQTDTQIAVQSMETAVPQVDKGLALANQASALLDLIQRQSLDSLGKVRDVAHATQEQVSTATDIARNVELIAAMAEQSNAAMHNNADAAHRLDDLAGDLRRLVAYFRIA